MTSRAVWALVLAFLASWPAAARVPAEERAALIALYRGAGGGEWLDRSGWLGRPGTECRWHGVTCDAAGSAVVALRLASNGLSGELPPELGNLLRLKILDLRANRLQGSIPARLGQAAGLEILDLAFNRLSGEIPPEIGSLSRLRVLSLEHNGFTRIPEEIGNLASLEALDLSFNPLPGLPAGFSRLDRLRFLLLRQGGLAEIPEVLLEMRSLEQLDLSENPMAGAEVPPEIGQLERLVRLACGSCGLTGPLPATLGRLIRLGELDLRDNAITSLPDEVGDLQSLERLLLAGNRLTALPAGIGGARALARLDLAWNRLESLPREIGQLPLSILDLSGNRLTSLPAEIGGLTPLKILLAPGNLLADPLPDLARLANLEVLDLSSNPLPPGPILEGLRNVTRLRELRLRSANRRGEIPLWLQELEALTWLDLGDNPLDFGPVPPVLSTLPHLRRLLLDRTRRTGSIPEWLGQMPRLALLSLRDNPFTEGPLPGFLATATISHVDLGGTARTGLLPLEIGSNPALRVLRLDRNHLRGPIPREWGGLSSLEILGLASNRLTGLVPLEIASLGGLRDGHGLDLRWNGLLHSAGTAGFLDRKQADGGDWRSTQTVAPRNLRVSRVGGSGIRLAWSPIRFRDGEGWYEVLHADSPEGPFSLLATTADKRATGVDVSGLAPRARHYFRVRTVTPPHPGNPNRVISLPGPVVEIITLPQSP